MSGMPGNPHEDAIQTHAIYGISPEATATLALAYEVRTVALLLASRRRRDCELGRAVVTHTGRKPNE